MENITMSMNCNFYNIGESHKHNVEWEKLDKKENILYGFIHMEFKKKSK